MNEKSQHEDHSYVQALVDNNYVKIDEIYHRFSGLVISYVLKNNGSVDEAKDIFQDAMMDLTNMGRKGFVLTCPFKPYFMGIIRNKWLDHLKIVKKRNEHEKEVTNTLYDGLGVKEHEELLEYIHSQKEYSLYKKCFEMLSPSCKDIIGLSLVDNEITGKPNSLKDIAEELDLNYSYTRRRILECIEILKGRIKQLSK